MLVVRGNWLVNLMVVGRLGLVPRVLCDYCHHNLVTVLVVGQVEIKLLTGCKDTILRDYSCSVLFPLMLIEMGRLLNVSFDNIGRPPWACSLELYSETSNSDGL